MILKMNKMENEKNKKDPRNKNYRSMLDQTIGSALDLKTNEDFNNEHPDHDDSGLINANSIPEGKKTGKKYKQTLSDKSQKWKERRSENLHLLHASWSDFG